MTPDINGSGPVRWTDAKAISYLRDESGYKLVMKCVWEPPHGHRPTSMELDAIYYLMDYYHFGSLGPIEPSPGHNNSPVPPECDDHDQYTNSE
jgi:hypothetical protein